MVRYLMKTMKRRDMLAGLGAGTLLSLGLFNRETKAADVLPEGGYCTRQKRLVIMNSQFEISAQ